MPSSPVTTNVEASRPLAVLSAAVLLLFAAGLVFLFDVLTLGGRVGFAVALVICAGALIAVNGRAAIAVRFSGSTACAAFCAFFLLAGYVESLGAVMRDMPNQLAGLLVFILLPMSVWVGSVWAIIQLLRFRAIQFVLEFSLLAATGIVFYSSEFP